MNRFKPQAEGFVSTGGGWVSAKEWLMLVVQQCIWMKLVHEWGVCGWALGVALSFGLYGQCNNVQVGLSG
jgi:hypothetical protein